jgi:hypothetical protein
MKASTLIQKLQRAIEKGGDLEVVIDFDDNGHYTTEEVSLVKDDSLEDEKPICYINIRSSNEA